MLHKFSLHPTGYTVNPNDGFPKNFNTLAETCGDTTKFNRLKKIDTIIAFPFAIGAIMSIIGAFVACFHGIHTITFSTPQNINNEQTGTNGVTFFLLLVSTLIFVSIYTKLQYRHQQQIEKLLYRKQKAMLQEWVEKRYGLKLTEHQYEQLVIPRHGTYLDNETKIVLDVVDEKYYLFPKHDTAEFPKIV